MKPIKTFFTISCSILLGWSLSAMSGNQGESVNINQQSSSAEKTSENKIEIIGDRNAANTEVDEDTKKLLKVPGIMGDPLGAVFSLPGVVIAGDDLGGEPAIRGSSPDDNAYYIDSMPAGYIFHTFGNSIFNENLVQRFDLLSAGFGAEYGEAIGGVFDVTLRDPKNQEFSGTFDWSMIQTGLLVESGLGDNQAFYASYRKSLIHLYISEGEEDDDGFTVYEAPQSDDYQFKYQWLIGNNQKFTLNATGASDSAKAGIAKESELGRSDPESVGDLRLDRKFNSAGMRWELFSDNGGVLSLGLSRLDDDEFFAYGDGQFVDLGYKESFFRGYYQQNWIKNHNFTLGTEWRKSDFTYRFDFIPYYCTDQQRDCSLQRGERTQDQETINSNTYAFYLSDRWKFSKDWQLDLGLRSEYSDYNNERHLMPRAALIWQANTNLSLNMKAGRYTRTSDGEKSVRRIGNPNLKSPEANHLSIGGSYEFTPVWKTSVDIYYKKMTKLPLALTENDADNQLRYSNDMSGNAKGIEFLLEKDKSDGWYAWASLSYSKSERTNERTSETAEYYLDTPLIFNMVANYQFNSRWNFGARLTVRNGQKYTPIIGLRDNENFEGLYLPVYGELNSKTLPTYVRLDLQAEYQYQLWDLEAAWTFAIINATNHQNISSYYYAPDGNETLTDFIMKKETQIGIFPAIGFKIHF